MDKQLLKLSKLCEHWANHNDSHKENFLKWKDIVKEKGLDSIAEKLNKAIESMDECSEYLLAINQELK